MVVGESASLCFDPQEKTKPTEHIPNVRRLTGRLDICLSSAGEFRLGTAPPPLPFIIKELGTYPDINKCLLSFSLYLGRVGIRPIPSFASDRKEGQEEADRKVTHSPLGL